MTPHQNSCVTSTKRRAFVPPVQSSSSRHQTVQPSAPAFSGDAETDDTKAITPARTIAEEKRIVLVMRFGNLSIHQNPDATNLDPEEILTNLFRRANVIERVTPRHSEI
ncbi:hypothetical protein EV702DRAFT_1272627 [Suillus placidus]|uniref:Uncharacterized protein n=1 Tax=Suillus placidus TaxID=48579 RepID=A0A9P6ZG64_9AGAM|nr:hypothetical protein EV702DRAFT_1272627 [Suillus placidus]